jgi:hypothetical protein
VHYDDPIIAILGYCEKRARARKKAQSGGNGRSKVHCACFGPHHGTRCPTPMRAVPDNLWAMYVESQELLLGSMSSREFSLLTRADLKAPAPAPKHLPLPQLQSQPRSQASASPPGNSHVPAWRRGRR